MTLSATASEPSPEPAPPAGSSVGRLVGPLKWTLVSACVLQGISSALGVAPFIAVAELGR